MSKCLHIYADSEEELIEATREVFSQLSQGNTSGISPDWDIEEVE